MYKEDLALNNLQWLICHKTQPNNQLELAYITDFYLRKDMNLTILLSPINK